jgi:saccharopine dehydrogenase-like NADP-dependent oxidoreductase
MGLLSSKPVQVGDREVVPMELILALCPPAPKYPEEIKAIITDGVLKEEGAFLVRVEGMKGGNSIKIVSYVTGPGLVEAFETSGLSHEAYLTGQCASVFVKMMVEDVFVERGLFVPEQLGDAARAYCFRNLAELGVTIEETLEQKTVYAGSEALAKA